MKQPPANALRVPCDKLETFIHAVARGIGLPENHATLLAQLLAANDRRGVFSHGSALLPRYAHEIGRGGVNPRPNVQCAHETDNSLVMDGDGGLGYFPAYEGTLKLIQKAEQQGMAAMVTRNHGHIGAAGIYAHLAVEHDLLAFVTSGVQLHLEDGAPVHTAAGASPMAFGAPALNEPALLLDCGVTHGIQHDHGKEREALLRTAPAVVLRLIGFGTVCQTWGGLLTGLPIDAARADRQYRDANQGAMMYAFKLSLFAEPEQFKREMDEYAQRVRRLEPIEGTEGAFLPGGVEAAHEQAYRAAGVPLSERHQRNLESLAQELNLAVPWA